MTKREREEYREYESLLEPETIPARQLVRFANLDVTPARWADVAASGYGDYSPADNGNPQPLTDLTWLLFDESSSGRRRAVAKGPKGRVAVRRLQREVSDVLAALVLGDAAPVERFVNRGGVFRCRVHAPERASVKRRSTRARDTAGARWQLTWEPTRTSGARATLIDAVVRDVLPYADRLGRCERAKCGAFFLRWSRWATRKRRFCSDACSVTHHNQRRIAEGYYTTEAREARAEERARAQRAND